MTKKDLYICALGKNYGYYSDLFEKLDRGSRWYTAWNWFSCLFGPLWMANRRFPFFWCLTIISVSTLVMAVLSYELPVVGTPLAVLAYAITYGVVTPYFYYVAIDSFIHRNSEVTREELW